MSFPLQFSQVSRYGKNGALDVTTRSTSGVLIWFLWFLLLSFPGLWQGWGIVLDTVGLVAAAVVMTGSEDLIRGGMDRQQGWAG
jgi:hypothetical protein